MSCPVYETLLKPHRNIIPLEWVFEREFLSRKYETESWVHFPLECLRMLFCTEEALQKKGGSPIVVP
jgi:hypothetical protein